MLERKPKYHTFESVVKKGIERGLPEPKLFDTIHLKNWLHDNTRFLSNALDQKLEGLTPNNDFFILGRYNLNLKEDEVRKLVNLFPKESLGRIDTLFMRGGSTVWMHKDISAKRLLLTDDPKESLSPISVAYGATRQIGGSGLGRAVDITLHKLPVGKGYYSRNEARVIQASTVVHEMFHAINPFRKKLDTNLRYLQLPSGEITDLGVYISQVFRRVIDKFPPSSKYAAAFRANGERYSEKSRTVTRRGLSEEFAENGSLYLLGYNCGTYLDLSSNPFYDRPSVAAFYQDFLNAKQFELTTRAEAIDYQIKTVHPNTLVAKYQKA